MAIEQATVQHVVAVPYPAQGHINPMLQLCQQLVPHGFTFTFVNTHHIHQRVQSANSTDNKSDGHIHGDAYVHDPKHSNGHANAINTHHHGDNQVHEAGKGVDTGNQEFGTQDAHANGGSRDGQIMKMQSHQQKGCKSPIRMVYIDGGCAPEQHAHLSTSKDAFFAAQDMKEQVEQLVSDIMEEVPVAFILTDILLGWSNDTASKFGLPWVCFWAASAATCAIFIYFGELAEEGKLIPIADGGASIIDDIPGLPPTRLHDLPKVWDDTGLYHLLLKYFLAAHKARFLLLNTFEEIEGQLLQAFSKRYSPLAVGPLLPSRYLHTCPDTSPSTEHEYSSLFKEDRTCLDWLDTQALSSVLFISFGSISARAEEQLEELALGVQASGCPFLWVRRPDISADFTPLNGGNGLIVPWAPQLEVLSHPAVGGFITHCGWNSMMESVAMGVPMLCWADTGERISNQRFAVQIWKCGLDMVSDSRRHTQHIDEAVLVTREEIEKSIRCLMLEEVGAPIRARAAQLRVSTMLAYQDSQSHFNHFVQTMQQKGFDNTL